MCLLSFLKNFLEFLNGKGPTRMIQGEELYWNFKNKLKRHYGKKRMDEKAHF